MAVGDDRQRAPGGRVRRIVRYAGAEHVTAGRHGVVPIGRRRHAGVVCLCGPVAARRPANRTPSCRIGANPAIVASAAPALSGWIVRVTADIGAARHRSRPTDAGLLDRHFEQPDAGLGHSRVPGASSPASSAVPASTDEPSRGAGPPCPTRLLGHHGGCHPLPRRHHRLPSAMRPRRSAVPVTGATGHVYRGLTGRRPLRWSAQPGALATVIVWRCIELDG
jgi:hypothetical protein